MPSAEVIAAEEQNGVSPNDLGGRVLREEVFTYSCRSHRRRINRLELADGLFTPRLDQQPTIGDSSNSGGPFSRRRGIAGQRGAGQFKKKT